MAKNNEENLLKGSVNIKLSSHQHQVIEIFIDTPTFPQQIHRALQNKFLEFF